MAQFTSPAPPLPARSIEIRRHSYTKKGPERGKGSHLSPLGVALARHIGTTIGPFDLVLTSDIPRTLETALAMGFAVDDQLAPLGHIAPDVIAEIGHHDRWQWETPFAQFARFVAEGGATTRLAHHQRGLWLHALESLPTNGKLLIISHGRVMEAGLVACFPNGPFDTWGPAFHQCEGVRMSYVAGRLTDLVFLRTPPPPAPP